MGCSESLPPVPPHFVSFAWRYHACRAVVRARPFAAPTAPRRTSGWPGVFQNSAGCPIPALNVETTGLPGFLGNPDVDVPCSSTPAGPAGPGLYSPTDAAFRSRKGVGSRDVILFRGSITWPIHSLSTLRSRDCSRTTQDSLPAAGLLCRAGLVTRWVPLQGLAPHVAPPCPGFTWRTATFVSGGTERARGKRVVFARKEGFHCGWRIADCGLAHDVEESARLRQGFRRGRPIRDPQSAIKACDERKNAVAVRPSADRARISGRRHRYTGRALTCPAGPDTPP